MIAGAVPELLNGILVLVLALVAVQRARGQLDVERLVLLDRPPLQPAEEYCENWPNEFWNRRNAGDPLAAEPGFIEVVLGVEQVGLLMIGS